MIFASSDELYDYVPDESVQLILTDPPYGTGTTQTLQGKSYTDDVDTAKELIDVLGDFALRALTPTGVLAIFLDHRLVHWAHELLVHKGLTPHGELIWHAMLGGVKKSWWTTKHQTIILFDRNGKGYFDHSFVPEKKRLATRGKYTADKLKKWDSVIDCTLSPTDPERVGYPSQKPLAILEPLVQVHTQKGDLVVDPFMGSGSTLVAATKLNREVYGADISEDARQITKERL